VRPLAFLICFVICFVAAPLYSVAAQQAPHDTLRGAVRHVDSRGIEVTTGVGMALRVVRLQVAAATRVTTRGAALALHQLQPGDVVRVSFGLRPAGYVAYTIERVGRMASGPEPWP
jgi:hypothetical protein